MRAAHRRMMDEAANALREAIERAERVHMQSQREYETFQRAFERDRQERAVELQDLGAAAGRRREECRRLEADLERVKARSEQETAEPERARIDAERRSEEHTSELHSQR